LGHLVNTKRLPNRQIERLAIRQKPTSLLKTTTLLLAFMVAAWHIPARAATTVRFGDNTADDFAGAVEDAFIFERSGYETYNYGVRASIGVGEPSNLARTRRMLIRFKDIASNIGTGKQIVSATMYLYCSGETSATDYRVSAYRALLNWVEGNSDGVTEQGASCWNAAQYNAVSWNTAGCDAASDATVEDSTADRRSTAEAGSLITGTGQYFTWDVTTAVQNWYSNNWSEYGLVLINDGEGTADSRKIFRASHTDTVDGQRPYLSVTYDDVAVDMHYVWSGGSNESPYTLWTTAAHSIQDAIDVSSVGHTVIVHNGVYYESIAMKDGVDVVNNPGDLPLIVGGGSSAVVGFSGAFPNGCTLSGFDVRNGGATGGIYLQGTGSGITNATRVQNCSVHGNSGPGIKLDGSGTATTGPAIENNDIYSNGLEGILVLNAGSAAQDAVIANNTIRDQTTEAGVNIGGASYATIGTDNLIYSNYAGIAFDTGNPSSQTVTITGNELYGNSYAGIVAKDGMSGNVTMTGNAIYQNSRGGIGIENACDLDITRNEIRDNVRGGIHTGTDLADGGGFSGSTGSAVLSIQQNKVHNNGASDYGGGIDVRHASGTIHNNLVYENNRGGIRFGDFITEIINNTVADNGPSGLGGGIIYDDLAGAVNDQPNGNLAQPYPVIRNNISAYNEKAGMRVGYMPTESPTCPDNLDYDVHGKYWDYNLVYLNNETTYDCKWGQTYPDRQCVNRNYAGCGLDDNWQMINPHDIIADPLFADKVADNYQLQTGSPAKGAGYDGTDMGAYGGANPIDW